MYEKTFSPIQIGDIPIPNRIFRPAHEIAMCVNNRISDRFIAYHEARARGGAGLIILEAASVHPSSPQPPFLMTVWDDEAIDGLRRLRERIAKYPTKVFAQLLHGGYNNMPWGNGSPPWSASEMTGYAHGIPSIAMTKAMIDEIVEAYRLAAMRAKSAGLNGIEIHAAHGYLPMQFLSANSNRRTDQYGGPLENRVRFLQEVLKAIRGSASKDFAIGIRLSADLLEGGYDDPQIARTVEILQRDHLIDFLNLSIGEYITSEIIGGAMHQPAGYELDFYPVARKSVAVPLLVTGRIRAVDEAEQIIRSGAADMVGMVRAQIADPNLIRKTLEGRVDEVRPCIACNQRCIAGLWVGNVGCAVNAAVGFEDTLGDDKLPPCSTPRKVLVVGGGVAGMEAARVAAMRGHQVTLCEAGEHLGGKVRFVSTRAPKMLAIGDIAIWLESEIRRLGVDVRTNTYLEASDVETLGPDVVVLATGATARLDGFQRHRPGHKVKGVAKSHVVSSTDIFLLPATRLGESAVVVDDVGHYEAIAVAEYLISKNLQVTFVTRHFSFAPLAQFALRATPAYERMNRTGKFSVRTRAALHEIEDATVILFDEVQDAKPEIVPADTVVLIGYDQSLNEMRDQLETKGFEVKCVGDALSPRFIEGAIGDGYLTALGI